MPTKISACDLDALRRGLDWCRRFERSHRIPVEPMPREGSREWREAAKRGIARAIAQFGLAAVAMSAVPR